MFFLCLFCVQFLEIGYLRDIFQQFDSIGNGEITLPEFKALYQEHYDYTDEELESLFRGIDLE
jgi:Ca2+-binding EF-hand superfamily protein